VLAFLFDEAGSDRVAGLFEEAAEADYTVWIAAPNWAEVRYMIERKVGQAHWERARAQLLGLPLKIAPVDQSLAELAGEIKAFKKMSLADCFAAALAKQKQSDVYTGDPEFREVENKIRVVWL